MAKPRVALLPLYLALYDEVRPQYQPQMEAFAQRVADRLVRAGLEVLLGPVCRVRSEVEAAVADAQRNRPDLIATLHLAYSPSLESADVLASLDCPLLLLDTTPSPTFGPEADMDDLFRNHGIHGVQDLASVLRRRRRDYFLAVGHVDSPGFVSQVLTIAHAARAACSLRGTRVVIFGDEFEGMGDFAVSPELLGRALDITVLRLSVASLAESIASLSEAELAAEAEADARDFDLAAVSSQALANSNRVGLAVRRTLEQEKATAFSFNFQSFDGVSGVPTVPFLEASKAMARGVGYAGEGDALTAAFVGALLQSFGRTTFTEMFCPDWQEGTLFMSHMGEMNPRLAHGKPALVEKNYPFGDVANPVIARFALQPGPATLANLAPGPEDTFTLLAARVLVLDRGPQPGFPDVPHYWIKSLDADLPDFLCWYSERGGTHHSALVLGDHVAALAAMAKMLGLNYAGSDELRT